jgi:hypothetical protein
MPTNKPNQGSKTLNAMAVITIAPRSVESCTSDNANAAQANAVSTRVTAKASGYKGSNKDTNGSNKNNRGPST